MLKWFGKVMELLCSNVVTLPDGFGEITIPTLSFNVVYILSHLYRHVFTEGIGLNFVVDKWHTDYTELTDLAALQRELKPLDCGSLLVR